ncbi:CobW family GTP-binding protein [Metaclostridioides mangenotii]|uniref:GTP-binding protein n=1 Tax=Metaclostridioides mangenotii TaxID=1540 RepID=UPI0026EECDE5|nr:CobW family GTP-binding protein [Clostridioides mangenotii]
MNREVYVISGFLGSGKTTLIQKLLRESFKDQNIALIENDFGEVSMDAALLKDNGFLVKELNSGCICCTLSGDFVKSLHEIIDQYKPDKIIIEPSGVSKLSDVIDACKDPSICESIKIAKKITVVDANRCEIYLENFGDFFEDQVKNADIIIFSRYEENNKKSQSALSIINKINTKAGIFTNSWDDIQFDDFLTSAEFNDFIDIQEDIQKCNLYEDCNSVENNDCRDHGANECCSCSHSHNANDVFDTITIYFENNVKCEEIIEKINEIEKFNYGTVLRAKGILKEKDHFVNLQYLPGEVKLEESAVKENFLSIIGENLDRQKLKDLFNERI